MLFDTLPYGFRFRTKLSLCPFYKLVKPLLLLYIVPYLPLLALLLVSATLFFYFSVLRLNCIRKYCVLNFWIMTYFSGLAANLLQPQLRWAFHHILLKVATNKHFTWTVFFYMHVCFLFNAYYIGHLYFKSNLHIFRSIVDLLVYEMMCFIVM